MVDEVESTGEVLHRDAKQKAGLLFICHCEQFCKPMAWLQPGATGIVRQGQ